MCGQLQESIFTAGWGKEVPRSSGEVVFHREAEGVFVAKITLSGLEKKAYILCLNGKVGCDGNDILIKEFGRHGDEGKYDFKTVLTDDSGSASAEVSVRFWV